MITPRRAGAADLPGSREQRCVGRLSEGCFLSPAAAAAGAWGGPLTGGAVEGDASNAPGWVYELQRVTAKVG